MLNVNRGGEGGKQNFGSLGGAATEQGVRRQFGAGKGYSHLVLGTYTRPPLLFSGKDFLRIRELEELATARLAVLHTIYGRSMGDQTLQSILNNPKSESALREILRKHRLEYGTASGDGDDPMDGIDRGAILNEEMIEERDGLSHFILRLAYCKSQEAREWLVTQETRLFHYRLDKANPETQRDMLTELVGSDHETIANPEQYFRSKRREDLANYYLGETELLRVPFEEALSLVGRRRVALMGGYAFVTTSDVPSLLANKFRKNLHDSLEEMASSAATVEILQNERIRSFMHGIGTAYSGVTGGKGAAGFAVGDAERVTPERIEQLKECFPPCMRQLYSHLKSEHHLKHWGRLQLRLFLKGAGMKLDEQMDMWAKLMAPKVDAEKFRKEHSYNIRHAYGREGKRADYSPWSCFKILGGQSPPNPGPGEVHGCPFKTYDVGPLKRLLEVEYGVDPVGASEILGLKSGKHFQLACLKYFQVKHPEAGGDEVGNHPNVFYAASMKYHSDRTNKSKQGSSGTPADGSGGEGAGEASAENSQTQPESQSQM
uniref:DNA primase large subunit C-terminal domain-containing protein n=1 Tax=Chromera velia CCMP2878 TaxID=1169474 RepID=A0A0G4GXJ2_9ALVE|eukprot:Cvel_787.t1-p1 / transcript=Cvel_787.t1 / gene=Cvel_787 / organism=Chromera_velia_CCMP2878 / gene_product=DNA primase large subunit, putative / transcript_product=DNA primase large subunit, putative / location=Cvel_scaffold24:126642-134842(-) / protein_length=545 / sequence_SO=supercontig / SO=protein_coding / is_pseudo=false